MLECLTTFISTLQTLDTKHRKATKEPSRVEESAHVAHVVVGRAVLRLLDRPPLRLRTGLLLNKRVSRGGRMQWDAMGCKEHIMYMTYTIQNDPK